MPEEAITCKKTVKRVEKIITSFLLCIIIFYMKIISPLKPQTCRFYPSCSQYLYEALNKYGIFKGLYLGFKRLLCCHPFNPGGYHPVE
ncbi:MAG: membrane protein insertion efficiency factor YidD [Candidatus Humimicrobiaceae bacterium]